MEKQDLIQYFKEIWGKKSEWDRSFIIFFTILTFLSLFIFLYVPTVFGLVVFVYNFLILAINWTNN